jgi:hypothetical protein
LYSEIPYSNDHITTLTIEPSGTFLVVTDVRNRIYIYNIESANLYEQLDPRSDIVNIVHFSPTSEQVLFQSFDKSMLIYDLSKNKVKYSALFNELELITTIASYEQSNRFLLGSKGGEIVSYDITRQKIMHKYGYISGWAMTSYINEDESFALVGDKRGNIYLIELNKKEEAITKLFQAKGNIVSIFKLEGTIFITLTNGKILSYNALKAQKKFEKNFDNNDFAACYSQIEEEPILCVNPVYEKLAQTFEHYLKTALALVLKGAVNEADQYIAPFLANEENKLHYKASQRRATKMFQYSEIVRQGEFEKAYEMARTDSFYHDLPSYSKLIKHINSVYVESLRLLAKGTDRIALTKLYRRLNKIRDIYQLLAKMQKDPTPYIALQTLYDQKRYEEMDQLILKYQELKETPTYQLYKTYMAELEEDFLFYKESAEYEKAHQVQNIIKKELPLLSAKLLVEFEELLCTIPFVRAVGLSDFVLAYNLCAKYPYLETLPEYMIVSKAMNRRFSRALSMAYKGACKEMHDAMDMKQCRHSLCKERMAHLSSICTLNELFKTINPDNNSLWMEFINRYVESFGKDENLLNFLRRYHKQALLSGDV